MSTIRLQLINGYFYPTDALSRQILIEHLQLERFPADRFDVLSPALVHQGHALAVDGYSPDPPTEHRPVGAKVGGYPKSVKNPCIDCYLRHVCDSDECGRKSFRLFSRK